MKLSTSTSLVVASLAGALSSSALALPIGDPHASPSLGASASPKLSARSPVPSSSPDMSMGHSARVHQVNQFVTTRSGKGRPPAIRSGSGSRRSLPRRNAKKREGDPGLVTTLCNTVEGVTGSVGGVVSGLGIDLPILVREPSSEGEAATESGWRSHSARQLPGVFPSPAIPYFPMQPGEAPGVVTGAAGGLMGSVPVPYGAVPSPEQVTGGQQGIPGPIGAAGGVAGFVGGVPGLVAGGRVSSVPGYVQVAPGMVAGSVGQSLPGVPPSLSEAVAYAPVDQTLNGLTQGGLPISLSGATSLVGSTVNGQYTGGAVPALTQGGLPISSISGAFGQVIGGTPARSAVAGLTSVAGPYLGSVGQIAGGTPIGGVFQPLAGAPGQVLGGGFVGVPGQVFGGLAGVAGNIPLPVGGMSNVPNLQGLANGVLSSSPAAGLLPPGMLPFGLQANRGQGSPESNGDSGAPAMSTSREPSSTDRAPPSTTDSSPSSTAATDAPTDTGSATVADSISASGTVSISDPSATTAASSADSSAPSSTSMPAGPVNNAAAPAPVPVPVPALIPAPDDLPVPVSGDSPMEAPGAATPPLPSGFAAPTAPIPNDKPVLLDPSIAEFIDLPTPDASGDTDASTSAPSEALSATMSTSAPSSTSTTDSSVPSSTA